MKPGEWQIWSIFAGDWPGAAKGGDTLPEVNGAVARFAQMWVGHHEAYDCPVVLSRCERAHPVLVSLFKPGSHLTVGVLVGGEWLDLLPPGALTADARTVWRMRVIYMGEKP